MEFPFDFQVGVAIAERVRCSDGAIDPEIRCFHIRLQVERESVTQFEIGGVLTETWILELENIVFVEKLEMPFALIGDAGAIRVEGQLGEDGRWNTEEQQNGSRAAVYLRSVPKVAQMPIFEPPRQCGSRKQRLASTTRAPLKPGI